MKIYDDILSYEASDAQQQAVKTLLLEKLRQLGDQLFLREQADLHLTASAIILDPGMSQTLLVFHNIYQSFTWPGGHADGEQDLLAVALREAKEETGVTRIWPLCSRILSIDLLDVVAHQRQGVAVPAHQHFTVNYGLIAPMNQDLRVAEQENSAVAWVPLAELATACSAEPHMLPCYQRVIKRMQEIPALRAKNLAQLPQLLLPWYAENKRDLPWRKDRDPYHIWLAEVMLQQTRVQAVQGYYQRFLTALPTIADLAAAPEDKLLKLWEGLGYYSRARNLQKAARQIQDQHGGLFPQEYAAIRQLPGIGDYTAGAIASQCFDAPTPAIDGNVLRVLCRYLEDYRCVDWPLLKQQYRQQLAPLYPAGQGGDFSQSLMELGATVCLPSGPPRCAACPLQQHCFAHLAGTARTLPKRTPRQPRRSEQRTVFLLRANNCLAVRKRQKDGILAGMWELPNAAGKLTPQQALDQAAAWGVEPQQLLSAVERKHIFTHLEWQLTGYEISCQQQDSGFVWATAEQLTAEIALPTAFRQFLSDL